MASVGLCWTLLNQMKVDVAAEMLKLTYNNPLRGV